MRNVDIDITKGGITLSREFIEDYAKKIFTPLSTNQCVSCIFVTGGGKRTIIKYLIKNELLIKKFFPHTFSKMLFVFIDFDEILDFNNNNYLELINKKLYSEVIEKKIKVELNGVSAKKDKVDWVESITKILEFLVADDWRVIFVFNDFELTCLLSPSIYFNLERFLSVDKTKITYLFLTNLNLLNKNNLMKFHNLKYAITRNIIFFPLFPKKEAFYMMDVICLDQLRLSKKLPLKIKEILYEQFNGHPQLLKYSLYHLKEDNIIFDEEKVVNALFSYFQLQVICSDILNSLGEEEKKIIEGVVRDENFKIKEFSLEAFEYLVNLNLLIKTQKKIRVFGKFFKKFILNQGEKNKLFYDKANKKIFYGEVSCEGEFTQQEFKVLAYFLEKQNELVTRDEVAKAMWGSLYYQEKYSDWAIDKIISVIRKKLQKIGFDPENLQTIKKRGFILRNQ
jgi:hypothetical protein